MRFFWIWRGLKNRIDGRKAGLVLTKSSGYFHFSCASSALQNWVDDQRGIAYIDVVFNLANTYNAFKILVMKTTAKKLTREVVGGEEYEYVPLGKHIVAAPGVCGGRPTFKYTRLEVSVVLDLMAAGHTIKDILRKYTYSKISTEAIEEAVRLAKKALLRSAARMKSAA
jgi:uncharacterized protein (DUF433 family)